MTFDTLVHYLLDNRHRIPNQVIIDCLAMAQLDPDPRHRVTTDVMQEHLQANSGSGLSHRLGRLRRAGLIDYEPGVNGDPGYLINRVGPA